MAAHNRRTTPSSAKSVKYVTRRPPVSKLIKLNLLLTTILIAMHPRMEQLIRHLIELLT